MNDDDATVDDDECRRYRTSAGEQLLLKQVTARVGALALSRSALSQYADDIGLSSEAKASVLVAAYEALANVIEHAYPDGPTGTFDLHAEHNDGDASVTVTITDRGHWKNHASGQRSYRGRGLQLMRGCADDVSLETGPGGTNVRLHWHFPHPQLLRSENQS